MNDGKFSQKQEECEVSLEKRVLRRVRQWLVVRRPPEDRGKWGHKPLVALSSGILEDLLFKILGILYGRPCTLSYLDLACLA